VVIKLIIKAISINLILNSLFKELKVFNIDFFNVTKI